MDFQTRVTRYTCKGTMERRTPLDPLRNAILQQVRAAFNQGKVPTSHTPPSDEALFVKDSPIRTVHADVTGMMIGGIRGLFLQMLHPAALQGVLDYSNFREDAEGRFHRTAQFISVTTFGHRERAQEVIDRVNQIHTKITGTLPDGTPYSATDPRTLAWVHIAEASSFLEGYLRHARPDMPRAQQDEYYAQMAVIGRALHADPVPTNVAEANTILREFRQELTTSKEAREIAQFVLAIRPRGFPAALQQAIGAEAVLLLPPFARSMLGLSRPGLAAFPARATTWGLGKTLRWAMRQG
ncbi:oxygenase MpaB family protein [Citromicrobium sp. JLT1363]|uniref:oxygenase MpaB family protein n=1 Tax=Citromicrobium sp. JLT1363 TaxID=517722 RepID=UPI000225EDCF|nr:oxygenase MpaB family protein [Citromicrobium sp. JLT1363]